MAHSGKQIYVTVTRDCFRPLALCGLANLLIGDATSETSARLSVKQVKVKGGVMLRATINGAPYFVPQVMQMICFTPPLASKMLVVICSVPSFCTIPAASIANPLAGVATWARRLNKRVHRRPRLLPSRAIAKAVRQFKIRKEPRATDARLVHCLQVISRRQCTNCTE